MSEPQSVDRWAALAADLGAQPAPETPHPAPTSEVPSAEAAGEIAAAPPPPIFKPAAKAERPAKRPAQPAAWDQLADDLGIAPMPPPPPPVATPAPPAQSSWHAQPSREPEAGRALQPAELAAEIEAEITAWDEIDPTATEPRSFEPQEALDFMDGTGDEYESESTIESEEEFTTSSGEGSTSEAEGEPRRPRRRRRRRGRGRGREGEEGQAASLGHERPADESFDEAHDADEFGAGEGEGESREEEPGEGDRVESESSEGERRERRGRHRGRGRDRGPARREEFASEEAAADGEREFGDAEESHDEHDEHNEHDEHDEHDAGEFGDFEGDEDDEGGDSPRIGFRNIPTWQDAIGVMISKNMEARARNPGGGGPRGPGGRSGRGGRGRGRGDRGRRPERR